MSDVLTRSEKEIRDRLAKLEPLVEEHDRLERALAALDEVLAKDGAGVRGRQRSTSRSATGRRPGDAAASGPRRRRRRRGTRAERFAALVEKQPGITVGDAAKRLRTTPGSLYQVTSRLQKEGRVRKDGRGFHPVT